MRTFKISLLVFILPIIISAQYEWRNFHKTNIICKKFLAIKTISLILFYFILFGGEINSQSGEAKSLEIGNKWFYKWFNDSDSGDYCQEVIRDTIIQSKEYAVILDTQMDTIYWYERADSSKIFSFNTTVLEEVVDVDFSTPDSIGIGFTITNDTVFFWATYRARQCREDWGGIGTNNICFVKGIGMSGWSYYGHPPHIYVHLIAGIIEGVFYGDSTVLRIEENNERNIAGFFLSQNYPNPFNPSTSLQYAIGSRQFVTLKVYDILGREVATLVNEEKPAGEYEVEFNAANLPSGIYFYQLQAGEFLETKKMILLR